MPETNEDKTQSEQCSKVLSWDGECLQLASSTERKGVQLITAMQGRTTSVTLDICKSEHINI